MFFKQLTRGTAFINLKHNTYTLTHSLQLLQSHTKQIRRCN